MLVEKEVISPGTYWYRDEVTGLPRKLVVTPDLCRYWNDQGNKMIGLGLTVPVPYEHDFTAHPMTPKEKLLNNAGEVQKYYLQGEKLFSSVDVQDPDVKNKIGNSIRWTSPWISSFTDGDGREWKNVISHLALTTRPRIINQQPFSSIAAALSMARPISNIGSQSSRKEGFCLTRACRITDRGEPVYPKYFSICAGVPLAGDERGYDNKGNTGSMSDAHPDSLVAHNASRGTSNDQGSRARRARQSSGRAFKASSEGDSATAAEHHYEAGMHHAKHAHFLHMNGDKEGAERHAYASEKHFTAAKQHVAVGRSGTGSYARAFDLDNKGGNSAGEGYDRKREKSNEASIKAHEHTAKFPRGQEDAGKDYDEEGGKLHLEAANHHADAMKSARKLKLSALERHHVRQMRRHTKIAGEHHDALVSAYLSIGLANDPASDEKKKKMPDKKTDKKPDKKTDKKPGGKGDSPFENLEDESEDEASGAQVEDAPLVPDVAVAPPIGVQPPGTPSPLAPPAATPGADTTNPADDIPIEELLCDLLQALGVPMPDVSNDGQFKRHLYEAVMSKIKELTSKGMNQPNQMPDQNLPPEQQPNASQPANNPLIQQEQQPMMMSLQDIQKLEEPLRSVALSMHQETTKATARAAEADKLLNSLRDAKLSEANALRKKRIDFLSKWMPSTKADLDAMLALSTMALSMGDGGTVVDPMAPTLSVLEKGLSNLPKLMTTEAAALSIQPQPTDDSEMTEERSNEVADTFARAGGMGPAPKKQAS